jgi:hypothetical protein
MATEMTIQELLEMLIRMPGTFILQNEHGSMEFRGHDLYLHPYKEWMTIYHATPESPESQSHLHLRWQSLGSAAIVREAGQTPYLAFYRTPEAVGDASLIWYFPSFYDWSQGKTEIPANRTQYDAFVARYGKVLRFIEPHSED